MPGKYYASDPSKSCSFQYEVPERVNELPPSTPQWPDARQATIKPSSIEEREIAAAHHALDALGVPSIADVDVTMEDETETRFATHNLRLHGRIEFLAQRLGELGMPLPFEDLQVGQATQPPEQK